MSIKINIHPILQHFASGRETIEVNGGTVGQCLEQLVARFPDIKERLFDKEGRLFDHVDIYINGESAFPGELDRPTKDGDKLHIMLIIAGG